MPLLLQVAVISMAFNLSKEQVTAKLREYGVTLTTDMIKVRIFNDLSVCFIGIAAN